MGAITILLATTESYQFHDAIRLILGLKGLLGPGVTLGFTIDVHPGESEDDEPF